MTALGARHLARAARACSATSARAAPRTGTCACSRACSTSRRSACTRAGPRAARRSRRGSRPTSAGRCVDRRLGVVRARRRHRRRGQPARGAGAAAADGVDRARRAGGAVRDDERGRALAHRRSWTRSSSTTGARPAPGRSARCARHVDEGLLTRETLHAELGQIVAGLRPGRERDDETILFWHRGLSTTDIALGHALLAKAERLGIGQRCATAEPPPRPQWGLLPLRRRCGSSSIEKDWNGLLVARRPRAGRT